MDIKEGLKQILNTDNKLVSGNVTIRHYENRFWKTNGATTWVTFRYIPVEFELLDWKVKVPEPTLKDMLKKLEIKEFIYDDFNYYFGYDPHDKTWTTGFDVTLKRFGNIYFYENALKQVMKYMNDKHITWDEFITTWEEVQKERGE